MRRIAVFGVGSTDRGDDAAGVLVVRALAGRVPPDVELIESGDPVSILAKWEKLDAVILVDAVRSGSCPGTVQVFDGLQLPPTLRASVVSSHGFCVRDVIDLGRALGTLPRAVCVVGVEAAEFSPGAPPIPEVERAVVEAAGVVLEQIRLISKD